MLLTPKGRTRLISPHQYLVKRLQFGWAQFDEAAGVFGNHPAHGAGELPDGALPIKHAAGHVGIALHAVEGVFLQSIDWPTNGETGLTVRRNQLVERNMGALVASNDAFDNIRFALLTRV